MSKNKLSIEELRERINEGEIKDPLVFLESVMSGQDPRSNSGIYELIMEIDSFCDGDVEKSDWQEVVEYAHKHSRFKPVNLSESIGASKTLAEYLHPKRKQVEINGMSGSEGLGSASKLTEDEIALFKEVWNDEF